MKQFPTARQSRPGPVSARAPQRVRRSSQVHQDPTREPLPQGRSRRRRTEQGPNEQDSLLREIPLRYKRSRREGTRSRCRRRPGRPQARSVDIGVPGRRAVGSGAVHRGPGRRGRGHRVYPGRRGHWGGDVPAGAAGGVDRPAAGRRGDLLRGHRRWSTWPRTWAFGWSCGTRWCSTVICGPATGIG
jgi:hypothetical protein